MRLLEIDEKLEEYDKKFNEIIAEIRILEG